MGWNASVGVGLGVVMFVAAACSATSKPDTGREGTRSGRHGIDDGWDDGGYGDDDWGQGASGSGGDTGQGASGSGGDFGQGGGQNGQGGGASSSSSSGSSSSSSGNPNDPCMGLTWKGKCDSGVLLYCDGGPVVVDCAAMGLTCKFDPNNQYYDCL